MRVALALTGNLSLGGGVIPPQPTQLLPDDDPAAASLAVAANVADTTAPTGGGAFTNWLAFGDGAGAGGTAYQSYTPVGDTAHTFVLFVETPDGSQPTIAPSVSGGDFRLICGTNELTSPSFYYYRLSGTNIWKCVATFTTVTTPSNLNGPNQQPAQDTRQLVISGWYLFAGTHTNPTIDAVA